MPTPGPWTVEEYGDDDCPSLVIHRDSENRICFMATPGSHGDPAKIAADARLIAAAPDMLAALEQISDFVAVMDETNWRDLRLHIERQCSVIAKAEGK